MVNYSLRLLSGVLILLCIAVVARTLGTVVPLNQLVIAIVIGAIVGNTVGTAPWFEPGIDSYKLWLEVGIVLLGAQLVMQKLFSTGPLVLLLVLFVVVFVFALTELIGRYQGIDPRMRSLLSAGIGICGVSAVVAVAGGVRARQEEIAYAVTTVLIFDAVTLVLYPVVGSVFDLEPIVFGIWAGTTMFSTGPVTAAGFAHSVDAGTWAVVTKLVRNSLLGIVVVWFTVRFSTTRSEGVGIGREIWRSLPKFVVGFFFLALLASAGFFTSNQLTSLDRASQWAFLVAFAGLGFDLRLSKMRNASVAPIFVTLLVFLLASLLTLAVLLVVF